MTVSFRYSTCAALATLPLAALVLVAPAVHAAPTNPVTSYTSLSEFNAAATTNATYAFENIAAPNGLVGSPTLTPLTLTGSSSNTLAIDSGFAGGAFSRNGTDVVATDYSNVTNKTGVTSTLTFGSSVTAFATELGFGDNSGAATTTAFTIDLYNGATSVGGTYSSSTSGSGLFIGLTSTQAFDRAVVTTTGSNVNYHIYDNVRLGTIGATAAAPEPGSIALLLTAGMPVAGLTRRKYAKKN